MISLSRRSSWILKNALIPNKGLRASLRNMTGICGGQLLVTPNLINGVVLLCWNYEWGDFRGNDIGLPHK